MGDTTVLRSPDSQTPSVTRMLRNLRQAQGYLDTLLQDIDDPTRHAAGENREQMRSHTLQLTQHLNDLKSILSELEEDSKDG